MNQSNCFPWLEIVRMRTVSRDADDDNYVHYDEDGDENGTHERLTRHV